MKLNKIPLLYLEGDCLQAGNKLRDITSSVLSLADFLSIMYVNGSVTPPTPDTNRSEEAIQSDETLRKMDDIAPSGIVTITKAYPWYLS